MKNILVFLIIVFHYSFLTAVEDLNKIYEGAVNSWKHGRVSDAIGGFEYIVYNSTDDDITLKAGRELVTLLNETNENSLAIAYIDKLKAISKNDPYLEFEKGIALYSLNKYKQAEESFDNIFTMTSDEDLIFFSRFIKSMLEMDLSGYEKALDELQTVYKRYPALLAPSTYMVSYLYKKLGKKMPALNFLKDSLKYDSQNIQALIDLAQIYDDASYYLPAWQSYFTLKQLDYTNPYFEKKSNKLIKKLGKKPDEIFYWSRLGWPVHNEPLKNTKKLTPLKIGLYCDNLKNLSYLDSFYFISNSDFEIYDSVLGKTFSGKKNMQYKVEYIKSNRIYELKDNSNSKLYSTRVNFEIRLKDPNGVILIKNPSILKDFFGVNRSDKEVSNKIEIIVSTTGMKLINHTYLEHILPSIVSSIKGPKETYEVIKALTILVRTKLTKDITEKKTYIPDNDDLFEFKGLQYEKEQYVSAMNETADSILIDKNSSIYNVFYSINAAGMTYSNVNDNSSKPEYITPFSLFKWLAFDFLKKPAYSLPIDQTQLSEAIWLLVLEPKWIEDRINEKYKVGKIKNIIVLKRDDFGIVKSIKIEGTAADIEINGEKEISRFISGGVLRSNLFFIRPIMKGNFPRFFIVRGAGTGNFKGMCIYGANYLAKNMGYKYNQIIRHYFPDAVLKEK
ncbi:MAG: hypothetical protein K6357_04520 [Elusimicrobiota bacterium]